MGSRSLFSLAMFSAQIFGWHAFLRRLEETIALV
jgi:hypothetical protein